MVTVLGADPGNLAGQNLHKKKLDQDPLGEVWDTLLFSHSLIERFTITHRR